MKKYTKVLALALALTMLMGMSVFAEDLGYTFTATGGSGAAIDEATAKSFKLTADATDGMYLLLVLEGDFDPEGTEPLSASDILYVNQETASGGSVTFGNVYPNKIADSKIYLAGGSLEGLTAIGSITKQGPAFALGDVNMDNLVNSSDAVAILRHIVGLETAYNDDVADFNKDGEKNSTDAVAILRFIVGLGY